MSSSRQRTLHYGLDYCPAFWDWLQLANKNKTVFSIEKVADELAAIADELADWAALQGPGFFVTPDPKVLVALGQVSTWATSNRYEPAAVSTFLQVADYYIVGQALAHGHTVVTHEVPSPTTRKIKIPNACVGVGVKCMNPFEMLRRERARFVLGVAPSQHKNAS